MIKRHLAPLFGVAALTLSTSAYPGAAQQAPARAQPNIVLNNQLQSCLAIRVSPSEKARNLVLIPATLHVARPVGECGCKSAVINYRVSFEHPNASPLMFEGRLNTIDRIGKDDSIYLVATSDQTIVGDLPVKRVTVSCKSAE